jgi:hypothetical protein
MKTDGSKNCSGNSPSAYPKKHMDLINFQKVLMVLFLMVVKKSYEHLASYAVAASSLLPQMQNLQTRNKQQLAQRFSMHNYCAVFPRK